MISTSVTERQRRRSSGPKIAPTEQRDRSSFARQIQPICNEDSDVEAPRPLHQDESPPRVLRASRRRSSSKFRTRETILRILNDKSETPKVEKRRSSRSIDTFLSPLDWLMGSSTDVDAPLIKVHDEWEHKRVLSDTVTHPWFIMLPHNKFRLGWDVVMAWLLCIMAFYVPFRVCFYWEDTLDDQDPNTFIFEAFLDCCFALDIILNFFTAYTEPKTSVVISQPRKIAMHYFRGFFLIDVIATFPFGYVLTQSSFTMANKLGKLGRLPKLVKFIRAARLLKLLRVYKLQQFIMKLEAEYNVHHGISRLIKIVMMVMVRVRALYGNVCCPLHVKCSSHLHFFLVATMSVGHTLGWMLLVSHRPFWRRRSS
eukprot:scaffold783_cov197-Alexandrium_tamarense.AAC.20